MSSHLAFQRGRALALLALLFSAAGPTWAACNGNPAAKFDPTNGQTVPERSGGNPTTVTLDGSKSTPGNNDLVFQWTYTGSTPSGLSVTLSNPAAQKPTFVAPSVGPSGATLNFSLKVTCGNQSDTQTTTVNVTDVFVNAAPVASAFISPLNANEGQTVTLDGSASSDPDGQPITYAWTQISGSPTVALSNVSANGAVKSFIAPNLPLTTTLGFRLTVSDGSLTGTTDKTVSIVFNNDPPVAALNCPVGGVLTVDEGTLVNFSSAGSSDPEGGALTYAWSQGIGLPNLNIGGTTTPALSFTAPHLGYQQLGGTSITLTVTDALNASVSKTCGLFITDVTAPVIIVPNDITAEATTAVGASVSYSVTSQDAVEDLLPAPLACVPPSSSIFPLDVNTPVACTDHDANNNTSNASFKIFVQDTTAPALTVPGSFGVEATSAQGAIANWVASALDLVDGIVGPDCDYTSGDNFPLGSTTVTCSATDAHHNKSGDKAFSVTVHDTQAPVIASHDDVVAEATKPQGADVMYTSPSWHDAVDGDGTATCLPASGSTFGLGTHAVHCSAKDAAGNESTSTFNVQVTDKTPPVLSLPSNITKEATGPAGAAAEFTATASDLVSGSVPVTCIPTSGSTFNLAPAPTKANTTQVDCTATDDAGNTANGHFDVTVQDTTAPVLTIPEDFKVEAASAQGAIANYIATSLDLVDGIIGPDCNYASGDTFPLGTTTVTCTATDTRGNASGPLSFHITVEDTTPPAIEDVADITGVEATGPNGAAVTYDNPKWTDAVDGNGTANCLPASGSTFGLGTNTVHCRAQDKAGNQATSTFTIQVVDTTAPTLSLPANITKEATGPSGTSASFSPSASDIVSGSVAVTCAPPSGSTFGLGTTTVNCSAHDAANNTATGSFTVTVVDTTAPVLTLPGNLTEEATGPSGAPVSFSTSANDLVSGSVAVTCSPVSGSTFAIAATTVNCSAQDGAGNTATGSFGVTVQDTTAPVIAWHDDVAATALANSNATVTYASPTAQDIVDGAMTTSCKPASGTVFGMGSTEVTCTVEDAHHNKASSTFHVNVSYNFGGFLRPIDNLPTVNVVKAGQAIPVKFSLGGNQGLGIFATGYPKVIVTNCTGTLLDAIEETVTAGNSSLQYDAGAGQYIYVWKTDKAWAATCRQLVVKFVDGSTQVANFNFTR